MLIVGGRCAREGWQVFLETAATIKAAALSPSGFTRLIVEKPFGRDRASAAELAGALGGIFPESQVYRIDHYLGKEMVRLGGGAWGGGVGSTAAALLPLMWVLVFALRRRGLGSSFQHGIRSHSPLAPPAHPSPTQPP